MTIERVPFLVGGGAEHSAAVARTVAFAATGGKSGIAAPGDLRVAAQSVPNGSVRVYPGVATLVNSYAGGAGQSYVARNLSQTSVTIAPTGSAAGRSDLIVLSILDPEYEGSAPADPNDFDYTRLEVISGVSSSQKDLSGLDYPRPAIPLARIDIPKSTGTITSGMIKSLRFLANPRSERELYTIGLTTGDGNHPIQLDGQPRWWPLAATKFVDVPEWAQRVKIVGQVGGVLIPKGSANAWGRTWVRIGPWADQSAGMSSQEVSWDLDAERAGNSREAWITGSDIAVPSALRGQKGLQIGLMSYRIGGDATLAEMPKLDSLSFVCIDVEFYETAV